MPLLKRLGMGNAEWWTWQCSYCDRHICVSDEGPRMTTPELVEGLQTCPACGEESQVDIDPRYR